MLVSFVTVVVVEPVFAPASVTHTRIVFVPSARLEACTVRSRFAGAVEYAPLSATVPVDSPCRRRGPSSFRSRSRAM